MSDQNDVLDFLDDFNPDEVSDPTINDAPAYRRVLESFFCGEVTFHAEGSRLSYYDEGGDDESKTLELYFQVPKESASSDGDDLIQVKFGLKFAMKPAAMLLRTCGLSSKDVRNGLLDCDRETVQKHIIDKLDGWKGGFLQVPNFIKGKNKRYPKQVPYTKAGWETLVALYDGAAPTAEAFGIDESAAASDDVDGGDDPYNV